MTPTLLANVWVHGSSNRGYEDYFGWEVDLYEFSDPAEPYYELATQWTWIEIPLDGAAADVGFTLMNQELENGHCGGSSPARIVIDRMVIE